MSVEDNRSQGENGYALPSELPSRNQLDSLKPQPHWGRRAHRAEWSGHGDGHIARIVVLYSLLKTTLTEHDKIQISDDQHAALLLSILTHDLWYRLDHEMLIRPDYHQQKAANTEWLTSIVSELSEKSPLFTTISVPSVVSVAAQINRVHDYKNPKKALRRLQKKFPDVNRLPEELTLFRDLDAGLERIRFHAWITGHVPKKLQEKALSLPPVKRSLHLLHHPNYEETALLRPLAYNLYFLSTMNSKYAEDQWTAVMDTAQYLNIIKP